MIEIRKTIILRETVFSRRALTAHPIQDAVDEADEVRRVLRDRHPVRLLGKLRPDQLDVGILVGHAGEDRVVGGDLSGRDSKFSPVTISCVGNRPAPITSRCALMPITLPAPCAAVTPMLARLDWALTALASP